MKKTQIVFVGFLVFLISSGASGQWVLSNDGLTNIDIRAFVVSGTNLFVGTKGGGVFLSTNNGTSWTAVNTGLPASTTVNALAASGTNLFAGTSGGVFLSTTTGSSWIAVNGGLAMNTIINALAVSGTNLFAGTSVGVFLSTNNGTSWTADNTGLPASTTVNALAASGTNLFAGTSGGVFLSTTNGAGWTAANTGLPTNTTVKALAVSGTNLFAGTSAGVSLSTMSGSSWTAASTGLPVNTLVNALAVSGTNLFAGTSDGVYLSTNNGASWTAVNTGIPNTSSGALIGVRTINGVGEFYNRYTGQRFFPRGFLFVRLATQHRAGLSDTYSHSMFNVGVYNHNDVDSQLTQMAGLGYNTVRVWINGCCSGSVGNPAGGISPQYVDNVVDFVQCAKAKNIVVSFTADFVPSEGGYGEIFNSGMTSQVKDINVYWLTSQGVEAFRLFWTDFLTMFKQRGGATENVFGWILRNELWFQGDQPPFTLSSGLLKTANGQTYDLSSSSQRQQMMDDAIIHFIDTIRTSMRKVDSTALVTISVFHDQQPNPDRMGDPRIIRAFPAISKSTADFAGLNPFRIGALSLTQLTQNYGAPIDHHQPWMMETGTCLTCYTTETAAAAAMQTWVSQSCSLGYSGWLFFTWDFPVDNYRWATRGTGVIANALSPKVLPDPCR